MAAASYLQTSFLGGQWSPTAQGRADEEAYRTALNRSFNALPIEAGAHTRRPGTQAPSTTRRGLPGLVREFHFSQNAPYNLEFTDNHLRIWAGVSLMLVHQHAITALSAADPAIINAPTVGSDWAAGDEIQIVATPNSDTPPIGVAPLDAFTFLLGTKTGTTFQLLDPVTGDGIDGSTINAAGYTLIGAKVVDFPTNYVFGTAWKKTQLRVVQDQDTAYILVPGFAPMVLQNTGTDNAPVFSYTTPTFLDGPYLDPPTDGSTLTPSAQSGTIDLTASALTSINSGQGFLATDVGRFVRLLSEPLAWSSGTHYTTGQQVRFETGAGPGYYQALVSNVGVEPDTDDGTNWAISTTAAAWTWAIIASIISSSEVSATLQGSIIDVYQQPLAGGSLLHPNAVKVWRLGSWSVTTGYPTCGGFHEGRFYFAGAVKNRFEGTMSQENYNFAPTLLDGTVADNCGLSETIKAKEDNTIFWISPTEEALILGTQGGEWIVRASTLGEAITPTSVVAKRATRYGCANVEPADTGLSYVFVQRYQKQVYEYLADVYSRKFSGTNIARRARDLTSAGIVELAYIFENAPVVWARTAQDKLIGCTYKRESPFSTQPASFFGWHYHTLGSGRAVHSLAAGPSPDGTVDSLCLVTYDASTQIHYVEFLQPVFEETATLTQAWFLDGAISPSSAQVLTVNNILSIVYYGLNYLIGDEVTAWIGGLDAGDYTVSATGTITVPIDGSANPLLTQTYLAAQSSTTSFGALGVSLLVTAPGKGFYSPTGTAIDYTMANNYDAHLSTNAALSCFDWVAQVAYLRATTSGAQHVEGLDIATQATIFDIDLTGDEYGSSNGATLGPDGHIYYGTSTSATLINRWNTTTHATDVVYNDGESLEARSAFISAFTGFDGNIYTASVSVNSGNTGGSESSTIDIVQMTGLGAPAYVASGQPAEIVTGGIAPSNVTLTRRGPKGLVYAFAMASTGASLGFYAVAAENPTLAGIGLIKVLTPSAIQAGWTSFTLTEPLYDDTDGNVLYFTTGSDSTSRLIKLNAMTGAIMWKLTISGFYDMHTSRVLGGRLTVLGAESGGNVDVYEVDTIAGTAVHSTESTIGNSGGANNSTDDTFGQIIVKVNDTTNIQWETWGPANGGGAITPALYYTNPAVIGFNYSSQGQLLRPIFPQELGDQTGPGLGKTKRTQMYAALLVNTQGIQVGTDFTKMRTAKLLTPGRSGQQLAADVLFTDIIQDTLEDTSSFHSMWAWQTTRPYPTTVASVECFIHSEPR